MSDTPETIDDILAEMREFCSGWSEDVDVTVKVGLIYGWMCRIEAAADRMRDAYCELCKEKDATIDRLLVERDKAIKERAPGNAAVLREALERIVGWCEGCHADACEKVCKPELTSESIHAALAALAAPARNCDRFVTADEARRAFESAHSQGIVRNLYTAAFAWLFDKAGGAE